jgi:hypothetical protein
MVRQKMCEKCQNLNNDFQNRMATVDIMVECSHKIMEYTTILQISRKEKTIIFFLKEGEKLDLDNIVDVEVYNQPERLSPEDTDNSVCDSLSSTNK